VSYALIVLGGNRLCDFSIGDAMNEYHYEPMHITALKSVLLVACSAVSFFADSEDIKSIAITASIIVFIFFFLIPAYNWHRDKANDREYTRKEANTLSEASMMVEARTRQIMEQQRLVREIKGLRPEYVKVADKIITEEHLFSIQGDRVLWRVGGIRIPIWFAEIWWEIYLDLPDDHLPAISAFKGNDIYSREEQRSWARAITDRLISTGHVRSAGSQFPARWMIQDERLRQSALIYIGIPWALLLCDFIRNNSAQDYIEDQPL
jgi:hypothetical protein